MSCKWAARQAISNNLLNSARFGWIASATRFTPFVFAAGRCIFCREERFMRLRVLTWMIVATLTAATVVAKDYISGSWTLNVAKSKYGTGTPPKSQTTKLESTDTALHEIVDRTNADGTTTHWDLTAKYDGKEYDVVGDPSRDKVMVKKVDDRTLDVTNKKGGKVTTHMRIVVSPDGKTRTNTVTGSDANGKAFTSVMLFDKK
jgi:hypothetical protein